jgi:hypothetical protein
MGNSRLYLRRQTVRGQRLVRKKITLVTMPVIWQDEDPSSSDGISQRHLNYRIRLFPDPEPEPSGCPAELASSDGSGSVSPQESLFPVPPPSGSGSDIEYVDGSFGSSFPSETFSSSVVVCSGPRRRLPKGLLLRHCFSVEPNRGDDGRLLPPCECGLSGRSWSDSLPLVDVIIDMILGRRAAENPVFPVPPLSSSSLSDAAPASADFLRKKASPRRGDLRPEFGLLGLSSEPSPAAPRSEMVMLGVSEFCLFDIFGL